MRIALLVRLSMPPAVQQRIASDRASWAALTAGTHEPEPDAAQVQGDGLVIDRNADGLYGDGVQCDTNSVDGLSGGREDRAAHVTPAPAAEAVSYGSDPRGTWTRGVAAAGQREAERQAFLRRVQYVDPRERRA